MQWWERAGVKLSIDMSDDGAEEVEVEMGAMRLDEKEGMVVEEEEDYPLDVSG